MFGSRRRLAVDYEMPLFVPVALQVQAHNLIEAGRFRRAVWLLCRRAQLRLSEAVAAAEMLHAGQVLADFPMPGKAELADRIADLRSRGHRKEAVFTVRSERSLSAAEAEAYVDSV